MHAGTMGMHRKSSPFVGMEGYGFALFKLLSEGSGPRYVFGAPYHKAKELVTLLRKNEPGSNKSDPNFTDVRDWLSSLEKETAGPHVGWAAA